jgi:uncharacterized protein
VKLLNPANVRIATDPGQTPCLLGCRCRDCAAVIFPKMPICPRCRGDGMREIEIGRTGILYSHTIAWVAPKGFAVPFFQAFVELPEGPRVFSLVGAACPVGSGVLEDGMDMRLVIEPLADTAERRDTLTYKYVPASASRRSMS